MRILLIALPANRDRAGSVTLRAADGATLAGPFPICGRASDEIAAGHGNPSRCTTLPFGDAPAGVYRVEEFSPTGPGTPWRRDLFGAQSAYVLRAKSGDAALAEANGRFRFLLHGGPLSSDGRLRATTGHFRVADPDLRRLSESIGNPADLLCECVTVPGAGETIAPDAEGDGVASEPAASELRGWVTPPRPPFRSTALIAHGEYSDEGQGTTDPDCPPDPDGKAEEQDGDGPEREKREKPEADLPCPPPDSPVVFQDSPQDFTSSPPPPDFDGGDAGPPPMEFYNDDSGPDFWFSFSEGNWREVFRWFRRLFRKRRIPPQDPDAGSGGSQPPPAQQ